MKNYVQHGDTLTLTAPTGGVVAGSPYLIGAIFGVATETIPEGLPFDLRRFGVIKLPKKSGEAWAEGDALYWDNVAFALTKTAGALKKVAIATAVAVTGDAAGPAVVLPVAL